MSFGILTRHDFRYAFGEGFNLQPLRLSLQPCSWNQNSCLLHNHGKEVGAVASTQRQQSTFIPFHSQHFLASVYKLMAEQEDGSYNFDISQPPIDPSTAEPIRSWYKKRETVSSIFGNLASTFNEYRADCVALYLITDKEVLSLSGYNNEFDLKADDCTSQICSVCPTY